jgi:hypothetical protein
MKTRYLNPMQRMIRWLVREDPPHEIPLCDVGRLGEALMPGDVLLVEGRSRVGRVIRAITQSPWTHAALYLGHLHDIVDPNLRALVVEFYRQDHSEQLLIEAVLGEGTRVTPLSKYHRDHLRICRPSNLSPGDAQRVIGFAIRRLGTDYDLRGLLDLARFLLPWGLLPRRWRSSLFCRHPGGMTRTLCSDLIAEAYASVDFPILPFIERRGDGTLRFFKRNPKLFTPRDFDYSPYFDIIKYPYLGIADVGLYRRLPWSQTPLIYSDREPSFRADLGHALALIPCGQSTSSTGLPHEPLPRPATLPMATTPPEAITP